MARPPPPTSVVKANLCTKINKISTCYMHFQGFFVFKNAFAAGALHFPDPISYWKGLTCPSPRTHTCSQPSASIFGGLSSPLTILISGYGYVLKSSRLSCPKLRNFRRKISRQAKMGGGVLIIAPPATTPLSTRNLS